MKRISLALLSIMLVANCSGISIYDDAKIVIGYNFPNLYHQNFVIVPFDLRTTPSKRVSRDVVDVMTDAFETAFLETEYTVVERRNIKHILDTIRKDELFADRDKLIEFGKLTNAHAIIHGTIRAFQSAEFNNREKPAVPTKCTTISFSVNAVHIATGEILWKGSSTSQTGRTSPPFFYSCDYDVIKYADKVSETLVKKIVEKITQECEDHPQASACKDRSV